VFVIAGIGALAGLVYSNFHAPLVLRPADPALSTSAGTSSGASTVSTSQTSAPVDVTANQQLGLEITLEQSKALFDAGAPFLDARTPDEYAQLHVAGAFHLTADKLTQGKTPEALNYLDPAKPVVIYCGGGACDASHNVAAVLQQLGFLQTHVMKDGMLAWAAAGYATSNENPLGFDGSQDK